jgi:hypothetical protein
MNMPKQSRPVIREVSRDPIRTRVEGTQIVIGEHRRRDYCERMCAGYAPPGSQAFANCVWNCMQFGGF